MKTEELGSSDPFTAEDRELTQRITAAISRAVRKAVLLHKQTGNAIVVWEAGKVKRIEAKDIRINRDDEQLEKPASEDPAELLD